MSLVSGQGGILIQGDKLGLDLSLDTLYYDDDDGGDGDSEGSYLSLCGVSLKGSMEWANPIDIVTENRGLGNTEVTGISLTMTDLTVRIDSFQIDAIRVGPQKKLSQNAEKPHPCLRLCERSRFCLVTASSRWWSFPAGKTRYSP